MSREYDSSRPAPVPASAGARGQPAPSHPPSGPAAGGRPTTRRALLDRALELYWLLLAAAAAYPIARYLAPQPLSAATTGEQLSLGPQARFPRGTAQTVRLGGRPVMVIRDETGEFHAFSALCTHLECIVSYEASTGLIVCRCHEGKFNLAGQPVAGPPPRPLQKHPVEVLGGDIVLGAS